MDIIHVIVSHSRLQKNFICSFLPEGFLVRTTVSTVGNTVRKEITNIIIPAIIKPFCDVIGKIGLRF